MADISSLPGRGLNARLLAFVLGIVLMVAVLALFGAGLPRLL